MPKSSIFGHDVFHTFVCLIFRILAFLCICLKSLQFFNFTNASLTAIMTKSCSISTSSGSTTSSLMIKSFIVRSPVKVAVKLIGGFTDKFFHLALLALWPFLLHFCTCFIMPCMLPIPRIIIPRLLRINHLVLRQALHQT